MAGHEAFATVPSAHGFAGRGQTCVFAIDLKQPVVIEGEICGVNAVILLLERPARQLNGAVIEFGQRIRDRGPGGGKRGSALAARECDRGCAGQEIPSCDSDVHSDGAFSHAQYDVDRRAL